MAQYNVIVDLFSNLVELKEQALFGDAHEVELQPTTPILNNQSFETYEEESIGTIVGTVACSTYVGVTFEITGGNTENDFTINSSTGVITTTAILDYDILSAYTLTVKVTLNGFPDLNDSGDVTINVSRMYHICADYSVSQSGTSVNNQVNYLSYNNIQLGSGTLGDYVIEWKLSSVTGTTVFVSGNAGNTDPDIQAEHPFYEPTQAGVLYPVFRYIEVNSTMYTGIRLSEYGLYSQDLRTCLSAKTVLAMTCQNGSTGSTFDHTIAYTNTTMLPAAASRSVSYALNTDGSTKQFAWEFYGYDIADRITIKYVSGVNETVIEDWVVGNDNASTNFTSSPKIYDASLIRSIFSLTGFTYTNGDYLLFNVTPSYNRPTETDTNWQLQTKCQSTGGSALVDVNFASGDITVIADTGSTLTLSWNSTLCRYELAVHTISGITSSAMTNYYWSSSYYTSSDFDQDTIIPLSFSTGLTYTWANTQGNDALLNGQLTITRVQSTNTTTYDFTNQTDYLLYKSSYATITGSTCWLNYSADPHDINNYKQYYLNGHRISMTSGDTYTQYSSYHDYNATFTFDDVNYIITIGMVSKTVGYTGETCNTIASSLVTEASFINNTYSGSDVTYTTIWGKSGGFAARCFQSYTSAQSDVQYYPSYGVTAGIVSSTLPLGPRFVTVGNMLHFYKYYLRVIITNVSDAINNYEVYSKLNSDGSVNASWTLIKKVGT